jgi:hypothetical protein
VSRRIANLLLTGTPPASLPLRNFEAGAWGLSVGVAFLTSRTNAARYRMLAVVDGQNCSTISGFAG